MSSLGGKNNLGRQSGARSSRASSTIFYKLRKLDRQIQEIEAQLEYIRYWHPLLHPKNAAQLIARKQRLDEKRKAVRQQRKQRK